MCTYNGKILIEQEVINLASFMVHKHYCENDVESVIAQFDDNIVW